MKICIYGAGAIGGYMGVMLKRGGHDVSLVARGAHLEAIKAKGLTLVTKTETVTEAMPASRDPRDLGQSRQDVGHERRRSARDRQGGRSRHLVWRSAGDEHLADGRVHRRRRAAG